MLTKYIYLFIIISDDLIIIKCKIKQIQGGAFMQNNDIRTAARIADVRLWEIAKFLGFSEPTMTRKMRKELSENERKLFLSAIDKIATEKNTAR